MPSFAVSIAVLGLVQAALVALPGRLPPLPFVQPQSRWWALVPAASIVVVVLGVNFYEDSATALSYLALVAVPPLAAFSLGRLVRGARPWWAFFAAGLFAVAWACLGTLTGETAATLLSALSCIALGWLLVCVAPAHWLRWGIYVMAALDLWLVAGDLLQGPNSVLTVASPGADLPRLQAIHFGHAAMGFGDVFVAALVGCLLAPSRRQLWCAGLVAVLALGSDLLFFAVDELPATVPVALALAIAMRIPLRPAADPAPAPPGRAPAGP